MQKSITLLSLFVSCLALSAPKNRYLGANTTFAFFSSKSITATDMEYDVDPKLLTSLEGSYKLTKKFRGVLSVDFDSAEIDKSFQFLGAIASKSMLLQITSGKLTGDVSLTSEVLSSPITFNQETEIKYLSADFLFRLDSEWLGDSLDCAGVCYHGIRLVRYQLPGEVLLSGRFGGSNIEDAPSILDPEFEMLGAMYTININTLRSYALGDVDEYGRPLDKLETVVKTETADPKTAEKAKADTENKTEEVSNKEIKPTIPFAIVTSISLGYGRGSISDAGKLNISNATSGKTLENESRDYILFDTTLAAYRTWNWRKKNSRWTLGVGYRVQMNLAYDLSLTLDEDPPDDVNQVRFDDVGVGYYLHGPSVAFYGSF